MEIRIERRSTSLRDMRGYEMRGRNQIRVVVPEIGFVGDWEYEGRKYGRHGTPDIEVTEEYLRDGARKALELLGHY